MKSDARIRVGLVELIRDVTFCEYGAGFSGKYGSLAYSAVCWNGQRRQCEKGWTDRPAVGTS